MHGVSSRALHRIILRKLGAWETLQKLVNTLNRCRGLIKQFQRGSNFESIINDDDSVIDFKSSPIAQSPTHVLIFDQVNGRSRIRSFLCKRISKDNLCITLDLYYSLFNENISAHEKYELSLFHTASVLLRQCYRGSLFPFELVVWIAKKISSIECVVQAGLSSTNDTWVLNEDHIHQAVFKHGVRYDTIVVCVSINREMVCSRICRGGKRPRSSLLRMVDNDSIMQCFNFVDEIQSSLGNCEPVSSSVNSHSFKDCLERAGEFEQNENEYVSQTIKMANLIDAYDNTEFHPDEYPLDNMTNTCSKCRGDVESSVHCCGMVRTDEEGVDIIASLSFEKEFNLATCTEDYVSVSNLSMSTTERKLFFYAAAAAAVGGGKDIKTLKNNTLKDLTDTIESFMDKKDSFRPANDTVRANKLRMCMSRVDKPLKKSNNEKGDLKLVNHARVLCQLGESWISNYVPDQLYTVDLLDLKSNSSYIQRSRDYQSFPRHMYNILTRSTLYKLQNFFESNRRFTVDKKKRKIALSVLPSSPLLSEWVVKANVKELLHQLSSIQYRCRDGENFSQRCRNNLCMDELYKLFDWQVYEFEQTQSTATSILERNLHQKHKEAHDTSSIAHKLVGKDGEIETLFPDPHYTVETHMPLASTPRLDLYFTLSELLTLSLLLTACVEHTCKRDNEYCLLSFKKRQICHAPVQ